MAGHRAPYQQANNTPYYPHTSLSQSYSPVQRDPVSYFSFSLKLAFTHVFSLKDPVAYADEFIHLRGTPQPLVRNSPMQSSNAEYYRPPQLLVSEVPSPWCHLRLPF